jgi:hypothetical protein
LLDSGILGGGELKQIHFLRVRISIQKRKRGIPASVGAIARQVGKPVAISLSPALTARDAVLQFFDPVLNDH